MKVQSLADFITNILRNGPTKKTSKGESEKMGIMYKMIPTQNKDPE